MIVDSRTETPGAYRQIVTVDAFTLQSDVSVQAGGQASAPDPHHYFDTALATCKALTVSMYARLHKIALDRVHVHVERDGSKEREGIYILKVRLDFEGALTDAEKLRLHEIAGRCPIHKLMTTTKVQIEEQPA